MSLKTLAIMVIMVGIALTYSPKARLPPLVIGIPGILLALTQTVIELRSGRKATASPQSWRFGVQG